ncbi:hypothetical protein LOC67_13870 [Stieleria sp. JC731]|uniref:hypothetical protein n=1 Tax=Pirellulaceae TaxID=2691357 RepID=UPI001E4286CF|nr:hypothetical protein [Stieleria sp. JC731]MCC9601641.1 hypothetical protein [Stieleria sp. JC731]
MTIKNSIRKKLRRFALFCLVAASTTGVFHPNRLHAENTHDSSELCGWVDDLAKTSAATAKVTSAETPESLQSNDQTLVPHFLTITVGNELTIDTCNYEKWLQGTLKTSATRPTTVVSTANAIVDTAARAKNASRTASDFNQTLATIAAAAGAPVPFTHWTEPFAMVGPTESSTQDEIAAFQNWIAHTTSMFRELKDQDFKALIESLPESKDKVESVEIVAAAEVTEPAIEESILVEDVKVNEVDVDVLALNDEIELDEYNEAPSVADENLAAIDDVSGIAVEVSDVIEAQPSEPIYVDLLEENEGELVMVETTPIDVVVKFDTAAEHVGSAPMVFTIEETFASYDMTEDDLVADAETPVVAEPSPAVAAEETQTETIAVYQPSAEEFANAIAALENAANTVNNLFATANELATVEVATQPETQPKSQTVAEAIVESAPPKLLWTEVMPSPSQPFCIRAINQQYETGWSPKADQAVPSWQRRLLPEPESDSALEIVKSETMTTEIEVVAENATVPAIESGPWAGSPECWLDELFNKADEVAQLQHHVSQSLRPQRIGSEVASLVVSGDGLASEFAIQLAQVWPAAPVQVNPLPVNPAPVDPIVGSGAKLLARAEAAEQPANEGAAEPFNDEQLAQVRATLLQWVDVAQSVIEDLNDRTSDVIEVARNRGTQDDSQVR